jgi:hypothetical protein
VSLQRCAHLDAKLADNATCGARCGAFPACVPAMSAELAQQVALALRAEADEHRAASNAHAMLDRLHAAISESLARKVGSDHSRPRW